MKHDLLELWQEARKALETVWFVSSLEEIERTDFTLSFRLIIRDDLFVQVFSGEKSKNLYIALIEGSRRVYGIDREGDQYILSKTQIVISRLLRAWNRNQFLHFWPELKNC